MSWSTELTKESIGGISARLSEAHRHILWLMVELNNCSHYPNSIHLNPFPVFNRILADFQANVSDIPHLNEPRPPSTTL